jgi:hypothetical protein
MGSFRTGSVIKRFRGRSAKLHCSKYSIHDTNMGAPKSGCYKMELTLWGLLFSLSQLKVCNHRPETLELSRNSNLSRDYPRIWRRVYESRYWLKFRYTEQLFGSPGYCYLVRLFRSEILDRSQEVYRRVEARSVGGWEYTNHRPRNPNNPNSRHDVHDANEPGPGAIIVIWTKVIGLLISPHFLPLSSPSVVVNEPSSSLEI